MLRRRLINNDVSHHQRGRKKNQSSLFLSQLASHTAQAAVINTVFSKCSSRFGKWREHRLLPCTHARAHTHPNPSFSCQRHLLVFRTSMNNLWAMSLSLVLCKQLVETSNKFRIYFSRKRLSTFAFGFMLPIIGLFGNWILQQKKGGILNPNFNWYCWKSVVPELWESCFS